MRVESGPDSLSIRSSMPRFSTKPNHHLRVHVNDQLKYVEGNAVLTVGMPLAVQEFETTIRSLRYLRWTEKTNKEGAVHCRVPPLGAM